MEHRGLTSNKEDAHTTAAAKAKVERNAIAEDHEDTKHAMEAVRRAFLKENMESSKSSAIPEIVEQVTNNLFVTPLEPKALPKKLLPPPLT